MDMHSRSDVLKFEPLSDRKRDFRDQLRCMRSKDVSPQNIVIWGCDDFNAAILFSQSEGPTAGLQREQSHFDLIPVFFSGHLFGQTHCRILRIREYCRGKR